MSQGASWPVRVRGSQLCAQREEIRLVRARRVSQGRAMGFSLCHGGSVTKCSSVHMAS